MRVAVTVMGPFHRRFPKGRSSATLDLPAGGTVGDALRAMGVEEGEPWNASIAGQLVGADRVLLDGEALLVFAPIAGGM